AATVNCANEPQFVIRPQCRVEETLPPTRAYCRGPELIPVVLSPPDLERVKMMWEGGCGLGDAISVFTGRGDK
ncbi:hypothetical protein JZ751_010419, partial [Albula glossodonta]